VFGFERVSAAYFVLLTLGAFLAPVPVRRAVRAGVAAALLVVGVVAAARTLPDGARVWLPHLYLALGYWLPSMLTPAPRESRFETWLRQHDVSWRQYMGALPPGAVAVLELSYMACFVVVPVAFVTVWIRGTIQDIERFWGAVLLSGFACYISLPWLVSRPPRAFVEGDAPRSGVESFNTRVMGTVSHQLNTFPSGHVAVATAIALSVFPVWPLAGVLFGIVAAGIAAGAAVGRYHYGIDVLVGVGVGVAATLAAFL
jgi:membrane-associated phospholipid phosphatase